VAGHQQSGDLRLSLYRHLLGDGPGARNPARPEDPRRGLLRPIYLYPMALSFIVTGHGLEMVPRSRHRARKHHASLGLGEFSFTWIKDRNYAIYCVVIAAVWQSSGFVMAMFLAGLRGVDNEIIKAAQIDGASPFMTYRRIIIR
jgi:glucose/mannose transport system permease protein